MLKTFCGRKSWHAWKWILRPQFHYVFVLGHMRSGSTVLSHLLMSHPSFAGVGERNTIYRAADDLDRLAMHGHFERLLLRPREFVLDQINHNHMTPNIPLLRQADIRLIFLLREPGQALASLSSFLGEYYGETAEFACRYYLERLQYLATLGRQIATPKRALFMTYDHLTRYQQDAGKTLTSFFGLQRPFPDTYKTFRFTARRGDPSARIREGIVSAPIQRPAPDLSPETMARVITTWRHTCETLTAHCSVAGSPAEIR